MPKYKATAYIRLSYTDDHSSESDSVSNQRKLIDYVMWLQFYPRSRLSKSDTMR